MFPELKFSRFRIIVIILAILINGAAPRAQAGEITSRSAILYDLDKDTVLYEQNADEPIAPASLTKVLSMFIALDYIKAGRAKRDTQVEISTEAVKAGGSAMGLRSGEKLPLNDLLLGMAVSSGNDASHAVAEFVGGSVTNFVRRMNARAARIGMANSNFINPHGMPADGQVTTARDMLTLARAYLRAHPEALNAYHNTPTLTHAGYTSWNKNPLLGQYPGADGLKSGWIRASGHNLIFTAAQGKKRLLAVILGAPDAQTRAVEACRLLDAGFAVSANPVLTVAEALDDIPFDATRIDPKKIAKDAGINLNKRKHRRFVAAGGKKYSSARIRQLLDGGNKFLHGNGSHFLKRKPVMPQARQKSTPHAVKKTARQRKS